MFVILISVYYVCVFDIDKSTHLSIPIIYKDNMKYFYCPFNIWGSGDF